MNDMFDSDELDDILNDAAQVEEKPKELTPQQKAAITRRANARAKAEAAVEKSVDTVLQDPIEEKPSERKSADKDYKYKPGEMRWITVQKERGKGGDRAVPVCVQGRQYLVPRGVKIRVPAMVAEVLMNAEETIVEWDGVDTMDSRAAQSYAVAVHDG